MYEGLDFDRMELSQVMRKTYDELCDFITRSEFREMYRELMSLPPAQRPEFVTNVVINVDALAKRGIQVPEGILIQTSAFGDRRPTLFAVKKFLPEKYHRAWENVNWTFGNEYEDDEVSRDPRDAWRPPLPVSVQNAAMSANVDLRSIPIEVGINHGIFERAVATSPNS